MMMNFILLQAQPGGGAGMSILMIVLMVAIFYLFIIRPQSKRQKELEKARAAMKPGDKVITSGGVYGILREVNSTTHQATIEVWDGVKMKVDMNHVFAVTEPVEKEKK